MKLQEIKNRIVSIAPAVFGDYPVLSENHQELNVVET
jgi:hypothetical protein